MTADVHSLAGAYALNALPTQESRLFADHLAECGDCRAEVRGLQDTAARLGAVVPAPVPAGLRERVLHQAGITRQEPPSVTPLTERRAARSWRRRTTLAVAAAVLSVVGAGVFAIVAEQRADQAQLANQQVIRILAAPDSRTRHAAVASGGRVTVVASDRQDAAVVVLHGVPAPAPGRTYQMWSLGPGGRPDSLGTMETARTTDTTRVVTGVAAAEGFAITVEPDGGSPAPTTEPVAALTLP